MKLVYQYTTIFLNFSPTSNHLPPLQVENCDSNSRLVVDEDDNGFRLERVKQKSLQQVCLQCEQFLPTWMCGFDSDIHLELAKNGNYVSLYHMGLSFRMYFYLPTDERGETCMHVTPKLEVTER